MCGFKEFLGVIWSICLQYKCFDSISPKFQGLCQDWSSQTDECIRGRTCHGLQGLHRGGIQALLALLLALPRRASCMTHLGSSSLTVDMEMTCSSWDTDYKVYQDTWPIVQIPYVSAITVASVPLLNLVNSRSEATMANGKQTAG